MLAAVLDADDKALAAFLDLLVAVASADGTIDDAERAELLQRFRAGLGVGVAPFVFAGLVAESQGRLRDGGLDRTVTEAGKRLAERAVLPAALAAAVDVAASSDGVTALERAVLEAAATAGAIPKATLTELLSKR